MQVIGNLGKDAIVNTVNGQSVINFSVAHTEKYKDTKGVDVESTTWVSCAKWGGKTAISAYLTKGKAVYVDGTPSVRTYTNKDGKTVAELVLNVRDIQLLGGGKSDSTEANFPGKRGDGHEGIPNAEDVSEPLDDLPF